MSVVLLDEIEKAHPKVFDVFLSILEDGRLTASDGRVIDFSNTTLIFTSNLGSNVKRYLGFSPSETTDHARLEESTLRALKDHFRPEFLNRIDHTVVFDPLTSEDLRVIVTTMVERITMILDARAITLTLTDAAYELLVREGTDLENGARPLRRAVQRLLEDRLSEDLLAGVVKDGDAVLVDDVDGTLVFTPVRGSATRALTELPPVPNLSKS